MIGLFGLFGLIGLYTKPYPYTVVFKNNIHSVYLVLPSPNQILYFGSVLIGSILPD